MMQIKMDSGLTLTHFCKRLLVTGKTSPKKYAAKRFAVILYLNTNRRTPPQINLGDFCYRACQQGTGNSFPLSPPGISECLPFHSVTPLPGTLLSQAHGKALRTRGFVDLCNTSAHSALSAEYILHAAIHESSGIPYACC